MEKFLLDALGAGFGIDQSLKNSENVAAVFNQARENVAKSRLALRLAMPFQQHFLRNFDVPAKLLRRMSAQKQPVEKSRFALWEVEIMLRLTCRMSGGWKRRVGFGLHILKRQKRQFTGSFSVVKWNQRTGLPFLQSGQPASEQHAREARLMPHARAKILYADRRSSPSDFIRTMGTIRNGVKLPGFARLAGRANEFAQSRNVRSVGSDAGRVDWQAQALSGFYVDAGIIELGQAKPNRWKHTLDSAGIDRARGPVG